MVVTYSAKPPLFLLCTYYFLKTLTFTIWKIMQNSQNFWFWINRTKQKLCLAVFRSMIPSHKNGHSRVFFEQLSSFIDTTLTTMKIVCQCHHKIVSIFQWIMRCSFPGLITDIHLVQYRWINFGVCKRNKQMQNEQFALHHLGQSIRYS